MAVLPFVSGILDMNPVDTLTIHKTINYPVNISFFYSYNAFFYGLSVGFTQLEEKVSYPGISYYGATQNTNGSFYDSLAYLQSGTLRNYFNYLNASVCFGKKWSTGKLNFRGIVSIGGDLLLSHNSNSALSTAKNKISMPSNDIRNATLFVGVAISIGYTIGKRMELFLAPYSKFSLKLKKDYPLSSLAIIGIGVGLRKYL